MNALLNDLPLLHHHPRNSYYYYCYDTRCKQKTED